VVVVADIVGKQSPEVALVAGLQALLIFGETLEGADGASAGTNRIHRQPAARAVRPDSSVGRARLAENAAAPAQDPSPR
jgi:hypothetical protein